MATAMELIAKHSLTTNTASVTFSDIPSTYTDLHLVGSVRTNQNNYAGNVRLRFNGATSDTNHSYRLLYTSENSVLSTSNSYILISPVNGATSTSDTFSSFEAYLPNYAGSTNKSVSSIGFQENNSSTQWIVYVAAGLWSNTAAVSSLTLAELSGNNFVSGSNFYLYGITKA